MDVPMVPFLRNRHEDLFNSLEKQLANTHVVSKARTMYRWSGVCSDQKEFIDRIFVLKLPLNEILM